MRSSGGRLAPAAMTACVLAAAAAGSLADARPTGIAAADAVLRAGLAAGLTVAATQAPRWAWILLGATTAAFAGAQPVAAVAAWSAFLLALGTAAAGIRRPAIGAPLGALASVALLRLPPSEPSWLAAAAVSATLVVVAVAAYLAQPRPIRRRVRRATAALGGVVVAATAAFALAAARGAGSIGTGIEQARASIRATASGETTRADEHLRAAEASFADADDSLNSWYSQPARLVPGLGQQARVLGRLAGIAHQLASVGTGAVSRVDHRAVKVANGRVDIDRLRTLEAPLAEVEAALARADAAARDLDTDWVVPQIRRRHAELQAEVEQSHRSARIALDTVRAAPALLGADGPRRYFVAFTTPAETRGLGGFMGNFAVLTADDGRIELTRSDRTGVLERAEGEPARIFDAPEDYRARYRGTRPHEVLRDITQSPDFPSVAHVISTAYPQARGGTPIDGVIAVDPYAIAAILRLTGPVEVEDLDSPLTADNAAEILLRGQYAAFDGDDEGKEARIDFLGDAARAAFDALLKVRSIQPARWAATLGPLVEQRRLLMTSTHPDERPLFRALGLERPFPEVDDGDFFALTTTNFGNNKIDAYLHRSVTYQADWDPATGSISARAVVTLRNDAPAEGLPAYVIRSRPSARQPDGTNWMAFDLYTPHQLTGATIVRSDGAREPLITARQQELGRNVFRGYVAIPARSTVSIELDLAGAISAGHEYHVRWYQQPVVHPDQVTVALTPSEPWSIDPAPGQERQGRTTTVTVTSDRDGQVIFAGSLPQ